ncbi:MAG: hypothetical protein CVU70_00285 [Deltaproteobacteria bacterium HGW-Deltaproteobacteria-5]|jgi:hypothetical protein|nr:MAG: hypothetical protein CVU70_00285 [Deltaproteobacteria bacterium HGW-Deltaproteobacteria-5]
MKDSPKIIDDQTVESDSGWRVEMLSSDSLMYSEEEKNIFFEIEEHRDASGAGVEWTIYEPLVWSWDRQKKQIISQKESSEILNRIELAFWMLDFKIKEII